MATNSNPTLRIESPSTLLARTLHSNRALIVIFRPIKITFLTSPCCVRYENMAQVRVTLDDMS